MYLELRWLLIIYLSVFYFFLLYVSITPPYSMEINYGTYTVGIYRINNFLLLCVSYLHIFW